MIPSPEAQLAFLAKLQRLFSEGDFTATYKFALLISIADVAVEAGHDDDRTLYISHKQLAGKFIELYWQQAAPYSTSRGVPAVLVQNLGQQAAVVSAVAEFRRANPSASSNAAANVSGYRELIRQVAQTISAQPVKFLQNFGGGSDPFLYRREVGAITLNAGVSYCLRRFQPLVQQLARSHWVSHIKDNKQNIPVLGIADDLESFLFETPRRALVVISKGLRLLTGSRCFYCGNGAGENADVDHFVPFSLYARDLSHNFVLAHEKCNRSKCDALAALTHLERWVRFIETNDEDLRQIGEEAGRVSDICACRSVARWAYANAAQSGSKAWLRPASYETVNDLYLECLR